MEATLLDRQQPIELQTQKIQVKPSDVSQEESVLGEIKVNNQTVPEGSQSLKAITEISNETEYNKLPPKPHSKAKVNVISQNKSNIIEVPLKRRKTVQGPRKKKEHEEDSQQEGDNKKEQKVKELPMKTIGKKQRALKRCESAKQYNFQKYRPPSIDVKNLKEEINDRIPSEDYGGHIFQPTKKMLEKQKDLSQSILDLKQCQTRTPFIFLAIPLGTMLTFQVIIEKDTVFSRQYSFWLGGTQGKVLLMHGKKNLKLLEDYYIINQYIEELNCYNFISKLESNATRKQFLLSNEIEHVQDPNKVLFADINVCAALDNRSSVAVYFPSFQKITGVQTIIQNGKNRDILKQLAKDKYPVSYLSPCSLDEKMEKQFKFENGLLPTKRGLTLMDQLGWPKLYTAKTDSKKYRVYASSGLSPLIIFATFIVLYES